MAAKLALRGHQQSWTVVHSPEMPYCDEPVTIIRRVRAGGGLAPVRSLEVSMFGPCRKCEKCLQFRQMKWRQRAYNEIMQSPRTWWCTLTFSPHHLAGIFAESVGLKGNAKQRVDAAAYKHVQRYIKRVRKASRAKLRYLAIFELGEETGRAHYHLFVHEVDRPITKSLLEAQWRSVSHFRLTDRADAERRASYVTTYATKSFDIRPRASNGYGAVAN